MGLTELEHFRKTVAHEPHGGVLYYASFTPDLGRRMRERLGLGPKDSIDEALGFFQPGAVTLRRPDGWVPPDYMKHFDDIENAKPEDIDWRGWLRMPGSYYHFTHLISPLRNADTAEEIEAFEYPSVEDWTDDHMADEVARLHEAGRAAWCPVGHLFEDAWKIRGMEPFLMDMAMRPELCHYVLDRVFERQLRVVTAAARAGVDCIRTGDDVATQKAMMFSPDQWYEFIGSRWEKLYAAAREIKPDIAVWYHSDGNITDIVPRLIEIGVTILNPVQPECVDPAALKKQYGDRLAFDGAIGTQTTMPFGTADDVRACVRERIETLGRDGALILSPTHILEPEVPVDNVLAFAEACREAME